MKTEREIRKKIEEMKGIIKEAHKKRIKTKERKFFRWLSALEWVLEDSEEN